MTKPYLIATCVAIALAPPLLVAAMNAEDMFVEDLQLGRLLYFSANH